MDAIKVGVREFRSHFPRYLLETGQPIAITRHGETIGYYVPSKELTPNADLAALQHAVAKLEACLHAANVNEDSLVQDFKAVKKQHQPTQTPR